MGSRRNESSTSERGGRSKKKERKPVRGFEVELMECGKPTRNGNVYPSEIMANAIAEVNNRSDFFVIIPKDNDSRVRLADVVGRAKMSIFEEKVTAHIDLMDTPDGLSLRKLIENGAKARYSTRGHGNADEQGVIQDGFRLDCIVVELET